MFFYSIRRISTWRPCIGVEIHAQLNAKTKLFSDAKINWQADINSLVVPFDNALPGAMPRLNWDCVELAMRAAIATNCEIAPSLKFDRKHYDYFDLPAGYQITQNRHPIGRNGHIIINNHIIPIKQIHIEQDSGKTFHSSNGELLIDLNRAGVGLIEIVSSPALNTPLEASVFVKTIHELLQDIGVCNGNLEQGAMRIDVNVNWIDSVDSTTKTPRVELKNVNGIAIIEAAVTCELERQIKYLASLDSEETRLYLTAKDETVLLRKKNNSIIYRFLPEFDLPSYTLDASFIENIKNNLPLTRQQRIQALVSKYPQLKSDRLLRLWSKPGLPELFETSLAHFSTSDPQFLLNWSVGELLAILNKPESLSFDKITPKSFAKLVENVHRGAIDKQIAKREIYDAVISNRDISCIADLETGNACFNESELICDIVDLLSQHIDRVSFLKTPEGIKKGTVDFFIGKLMQKYRGKIAPVELGIKVKEILYK